MGDAETAAEDRVMAVRAFNRFWTASIGLLEAGVAGTRHSLAEARVLFELGARESMDLAALRRELGLDSGYLSRITGRLRTGGLIETATSPHDGRRNVVWLTAGGREAFAELDRRATAQVRELLSPLGDSEQRSLVTAMATIRGLFTGAPAGRALVLRGLEPGDLGWVVHRNGAVYAAEYGWDQTYEALVARIVADYASDNDPRREHAWIAELDDEPVGCVFCVDKDDHTAQLRLLLVDPRARGLGIGTRLVDECVRFARRVGYRRLVLWTNDVLVSARRIYEAVGFRLVDEAPHVSFGRHLVGQTWELDLGGPTGEAATEESGGQGEPAGPPP